MKYQEWKALSKVERKQVKWADLPRFNKNAIAIGVGCFILFIGTCFIGRDDKPSQQSSKAPTEVVFNQSATNEVWQVKFYLKQTLNDPSSYESVSWGSVKKGGLPYGAIYGARHQYRARNAFNALIIKDQVFYMNASGDVFKVEEYTGQ